MTKRTTFWNQLESKTIAKEQVESFLISKLGTPINPTQINLLTEFCKKVNNFYFTSEPINPTIYSLIGLVTKIKQKPRKEGKHKGETKFVIELAEKETLQAYQEELPKDKWQQLEQLAILNQKLVFKYKKYITNKQLLDFYLIQENKPKSKKK